jgi:hypothetical protein
MIGRLTLTGILSVGFFTQAAKAVVVINAFTDPLTLHDDFFGTYYPVDVDSNGTVDFTFGYNFSAAGIRTENHNKIIISLDPPPDIGGPPTPVTLGYHISSTLTPLLERNLYWASSNYIARFVLPDEPSFATIVLVLSTGSSTKFNGREPLGFEFHAEDGIHYGYFDLEAIRVRLRPGCLILLGISGLACPVRRALGPDQIRLTLPDPGL